MKLTKEQIKKQQELLREELNAIEEKEWQENEEPLYKKFVGTCEGKELKKTKKKDGSLFYRKYLAYLGERTFLVLEVGVHEYKDSTRTDSQHISKKTEFFYNAEQLGRYYPKISEGQFQKAYRSVLSEISI